MIYLFTAIPPKRPYYKRDLLNICCHHLDVDIQFVYHKSWVEEYLRENTAELENKEAVVVFCEFRQTKSSSKYIYHPVRLTKILGVLPEGEFITILFKLGGFFDYKRFEDNLRVVVDEFQNLINSMKYKPTPQEKIKKYFVSSYTDLRKDRFSVDEAAWNGLIDYMRDLQSLKDSTFFKIKKFSEVKDFPKSKLKDINPENLLSNKPAYKLCSGKAYLTTLQVFQRKKGTFLYPIIEISETVASITGPFLRQAPPELEVDFVIYCKKTFDIEPARLSIFVPPGRSHKFQSPVFDFIAYVSRPIKHIILFFVLIMCGLLFISFGPDYLTSVGSLISCSSKQFFIKNGLLFSTILKFVGGFLIALANFLALRKLPTKLG
ncbi:MAG: hypothetical protein ACFFDN_39365 [Candidatus Hodarchaeota archaeon]